MVEQTEKTQGSRWQYIAFLPIPVLTIAIFVLAILRIETVWNPPLLIPTLNIIFLSLIPLLIAVLAANSFLSGESSPVLFLGCGTLALGLGGIIAAFSLLGGGANANVSIFDTSACLAGMCHLASAGASLSKAPRRIRSGWLPLIVFYLVIIALIGGISFLVSNGLWPVFFVQGVGPTIYDVVVLWATVTLFSLSSILMAASMGKNRSGFRYWYALGLGLLAIGLAGVSFQISLGDPLNWASRTAQYLGTTYMLIAVISSIRRSGTWVLSMEEALRESEARYQSLVNLSPDAILVVAGGKCIFANPAAIKLLGAHSVEEAINRDMMGLIHPDYQQDDMRQIEQAYSGIMIPRQETTFVRLDGSLVDVEVSGGRVEFGGKPAIQIVARDITERKRSEKEREQLLAEVQEARNELEARVKERTTELAEANEELQRRAAELDVSNKELQSFAYSVAHDLRAPARQVNSYSQLLLQEHGERPLDEQGRKYLQLLRNASQKEGQLIDDLLELLNVARSEMHRQPVNLSEMIESIVGNLRRAQPGRQVEVNIAPEVEVEGDPQLLRTALENLLDNAWKFTSPRPVAKIEFGVTRQDDKPVYFVKDNGVGFNMAYVGKLFGAFQRLHRAKEFPGTGIGLAIVQRIIQRHGGTIWAEGEVDKGATFYFTLGDRG